MCPELDNGGPTGEDAEAPKRPVWRRVLSAPEGKVLLAGVIFVVLYLVAAWAIASGVLEIGAGLGVRTTGGLSWLLVIVGVISIAFGIIAFAWPGATILTILWLVGAYALASGVLLCISSFFVSRWQRELDEAERPAV